MRFSVDGIISAMVTPFTANGEYVDFDKVAPLAEWLIAKGVAGLFPCGTTGEGQLLYPGERKEILEEVVSAAGKETLVVAHTGAQDLATTIELSRHAQECGANAVAVVAPSYYTYDDKALFQFFKSVAKAVTGFPVLVYNIPGCTHNPLSGDLILRLAESVENIAGIKDSSGSMALLTRLLGAAPKGFHVINGSDDYGYQFFQAGGKAAVSGTSNVCPELYARIHKNLRQGNTKKAWKEQIALEKACRLFEYGAKVSVFKEGMRLRGFDPGAVRPPQRELTAAEKRKLAKGLEELGLL